MSKIKSKQTERQDNLSNNIMIIKDNNKLITNWYRKPICSGGINYSFNHLNK